MSDAEGERGRARARARVRGRVQGVYYRASSADEARRLGLVGWVRNLADGGVELCAEGPRADVEALLEWCRRGPPAARVDALEVEWIDLEPDGRAAGFVIRRG